MPSDGDARDDMGRGLSAIVTEVPLDVLAAFGVSARGTLELGDARS